MYSAPFIHTRDKAEGGARHLHCTHKAASIGGYGAVHAHTRRRVALDTALCIHTKDGFESGARRLSWMDTGPFIHRRGGSDILREQRFAGG